MRGVLFRKSIFFQNPRLKFNLSHWGSPTSPTLSSLSFPLYRPNYVIDYGESENGNIIRVGLRHLGR